MKLFYSPHVLDHDAAGEINRGVVGEPFERPERAASVAVALRNSGLGLLVEPANFPDKHLLRVHDKDFVEFLRSAHRRWLDAVRKGDAIPMCWRADRMRSALTPTDLDAQLGYYAFDIMTPSRKAAGGRREPRSIPPSAARSILHLVAEDRHLRCADPPGIMPGRTITGAIAF